MSLEALRAILTQLPRALSDEIDGYVNSVHQSVGEIFKEAETQADPIMVDTFLFCIGIKRLWTIVDSQYWVIDNSLTLLRNTGSTGFRVGSTSVQKSANEIQSLAQVRADLQGILTQIGLEDIVMATDLKTIVRMISQK